MWVSYSLPSSLCFWNYKIAENKKKMGKNVLDKIHHKCIIEKLRVVLCVNTTLLIIND